MVPISTEHHKGTGLAKITGGLYRISDSEGEAIASFVPSPTLAGIDWESLKTSQQWLLEEFAAHWEIIAHWLVYLRTRAVDIEQMPFTHPEFLDRRELAELYSSQLDLCAAVWEAVEIRHLYPTPYDWWVSCMKEVQQAQVDSILDSGGYERTTLLKGEVEDGLRKFLKTLKDGHVPFKESPKNQHLYNLYFASIKLNGSTKLRQAWNRYLQNFKPWIKAIKNNGQTKAIVHLAWRLYYQGEKNHLIRIFVEPSSDKYAVLKTRAKFALPPIAD